MYLKISVIFILPIWISCSEKKEVRRVMNESGYEEGPCVQDSLFHGVVRRYDINDNYLGYSTYRYGIRDGLYINKYIGGKTKDSIFFKLDRKDGFSYLFDTSGKLSYKVHFINDRPVGDSYIYDSLENIQEYGFKGFEGHYLYYLKYKNNEPFSSGDMINYKLDTIRTEGIDNKLHVFIYLIRPPGLKVKYQIATIFNQNIMSTKDVSPEAMYYESILDFLPRNYFYALVVSIFNSAKGKDDLSVYVLQ